MGKKILIYRNPQGQRGQMRTDGWSRELQNSRGGGEAEEKEGKA